MVGEKLGCALGRYGGPVEGSDMVLASGCSGCGYCG